MSDIETLTSNPYSGGNSILISLVNGFGKTMNIKFYIASQENGIRTSISGWGNNKMFLKTYIIYTCYMI
jgi:hypothetical protein